MLQLLINNTKQSVDKSLSIRRKIASLLIHDIITTFLKEHFNAAIYPGRIFFLINSWEKLIPYIYIRIIVHCLILISWSSVYIVSSQAGLGDIVVTITHNGQINIYTRLFTF